VNTKAGVEKEIKVLTDNPFYLKINTEYRIDYINHQFSKTSGFEGYELIDEPLSTLFHADMPKLLLSVLLERLERGKSMQIIQKYIAKDGRFFWLSSLYSAKLNDKGNSLSYTCTSSSVSSNVIQEMVKLYTILSKIESKMNDVEAARRYLIGYLETKAMTYDTFIESMSNSNSKDKDSLEHSNETRDFILQKIEEEQRILKSQQQVSYSKSKKAITIKHDFVGSKKNLSRRA
jgi:PAS domain S-box-containing protein